MSRKNIEILKKQMQAFNSRDAGAVAKLWHPDGQYTTSVAAIEGADGVYGGRNASSYISNLDDLFQGWRIEEAVFFHVDGDRVLQLHRVTARAKGSGMPINHRFGIVWTLRDGLIMDGRSFSTPRDAFDAVGLSERDARPADP
jgi:ketosteroid isomerase-like protein